MQIIFISGIHMILFHFMVKIRTFFQLPEYKYNINFVGELSSKVTVNCLQFCRWTVFKNHVGELSCRWTVSIPIAVVSQSISRLHSEEKLPWLFSISRHSVKSQPPLCRLKNPTVVYILQNRCVQHTAAHNPREGVAVRIERKSV